MKTQNKLLKSGITVALAMTIGGVTAVAWPGVHTNHVAKADFGDEPASSATKEKLKTVIDKIFADENLTNRYLGTMFYHKESKFPYYHITFENHQVPEDVIDTTPWYNMWSEAAAAKAKLEANSYTEKTAQNAIRTLNYFTNLFNFERSHHLTNDGFYTTTNFTTPKMVKSDSDGQQDFYKKAANSNNEEIKKLFKDNLLGVYKKGQDLEINLVANPDEVSKITSFTVNKISAIDPTVHLGPSAEDQKQVAFSIPGELKAEQIIVTNMTYLDKHGNKHQTGAFALDIDYSKLQAKPNADGSNGIPKYREELESKIQKWIDRGRQVNEWLLSPATTKDTVIDSDISERAKISTAINELEKLKRDPNANYDKLYKIATPIHEAEDVATLREVLDIKVAKLLETFSIYTKDIYTENSIKDYKNYIESVPKLKNGKNIKELVSLIKEFENSHYKYLKYNTSELEDLIKIGEQKMESEYTPLTWEKFSIALRHSKDWIEQNKKFHPQINNTPELVKQLRDSINGLVKTNGEKGEQVPEKKQDQKQDTAKPYNIKGKFVKRGEDTNATGEYNRDLSSIIKNIEVHELGNGKNEIYLNLEPKLDSSGNVDFALVGTFKYNSAGNANADSETVETTTIKGKQYPTKIKLTVYSDKSNIELALLGDIQFKDSMHLGNDGIYHHTANTDLYLDYSSKSSSDETKKDPLKEELQKQLDYFNKKEVQENHKKVPDKFKTQLEQLKTQAANLLKKDSLSKEEVSSLVHKLLDENTKLDALANMQLSLEGQKDTYENFWKNNKDYTKESIKLVKDKLDKLEQRINNLQASDVEGTKETLTDEHGEQRETIVYKTIDEIIGQLQNLGDYLRVDTTPLEKEVAKAEEKLKDTTNSSKSRQALQQIIEKAKKYIENAKLTPDDHGTDDQVNTNLNDYFIEQLKLAVQDLKPDTGSEEKPANKDGLNAKIKEVEAVKQGKKSSAAYTTLQSELEKAKKVYSKTDATAEEISQALTNLTSALDTFNKSEDSKPNDETNQSRTKVEAEFKKFGESSNSMTNAVLKEAYFVTENGKNYIELILQPMYNNQNQPSGVLSKLTTFDNNNAEHDTTVLEEKEITLTFNGQSNTYKYPTKLRIPIEGKPTKINVNTYANSPVFGMEQHVNKATLEISYPTDNNNEGSREELQTLFKTATSKYYESWTSVFKKNGVEKDKKIVDNFNNKINNAQSVLNNNSATDEQISTAYVELRKARIQYDFLIRLRRENEQLLANFNLDKNSGKYSKESIDKVDHYLQEKVDRLEALLEENPSSNEIEDLFDAINNYSYMLRYDTGKLEEAITKANKKLAEKTYTEESKSKLTIAINNAKDFIEKAKATRNLEDKREALLSEINKAVDNLKETSQPDDNQGNKPNENEKLEAEKTKLLIPLETAKILIKDDKDKDNINKDAYNKLNEVVEKVQKIYDNPKSIDEIKSAKEELDNAIKEYDKNKNTKPNDDNNSGNGNNNSNDNQGKDQNNNSKPDDNQGNNQNNNNNQDNNNSNTNDQTPNKPTEDVTKQIFNNDKTGVSVELSGNTKAKGLSANEINDLALAKSILEKLNLPADNKIRIFDLKLLDKDNKVINSNEKRTVAIVLKAEEKDVAVYHVKDNGELELIKSRVENGVLKFEIDHFSKFAIVSNSKKHKTGNNDNPNIMPTSNITPTNSTLNSTKTLSKTGLENKSTLLVGAITLGLGVVLLTKRRKNRH
ncbi:peptidase [Gemella bergeri]